MKTDWTHLDEFRLHKFKDKEHGTLNGETFGCFYIPYQSFKLKVIASSGTEDLPWEHVSVSLPNRNPNWDEMCFIKDLFWEDEETVIQFHPKKSEYKNIHIHCLHMWKEIRTDHTLPPNIMV